MVFFIMIVAAAGMIFGAVKMKQGMEWGKGVTIVCAVLVLISAGLHTKKQMGGNRNRISKKEIERIWERDEEYVRIAAEKLGKSMAAAYPGSKAVIIRPVELEMEYTEKDVALKIDGLKRGFGQDIQIIATLAPEIPPEALQKIEAVKKQNMEASGKATVPDDFMMAMGFGENIDADTINKLAKKMPADADMVVFLIDFPYDLEKISLWSKKPLPKVSGIVYNIPPKMKAAVEAGYIAAVVLPKPDGDYKSMDVPKDTNEAFNRRWFMLTPENVKEMTTQYGQLFPQG